MKRNAGFSLIEISIVILVIAVIIAGFFAAIAIKGAAERQALLTQVGGLKNGVIGYYDYFHKKPGDEGTTASDRWGLISSNCHTGAASGTAVCPGNDNDKVEANNTLKEHIGAARMLGVSQFWNENFTGDTIGDPDCEMNIKGGLNAVTARVKGGHIYYATAVSGTPYVPGVADPTASYISVNSCTAGEETKVEAIWVGGQMQLDPAMAGGCIPAQKPLFTGAEVMQLEEKVDDGYFSFGKLRGQFTNTNTYTACNDAGSPTRYNINSSEKNCAVVFLLKL